MAVAAVAMFDSRAHALPEDVQLSPGGLGPGFYPFWAAALISIAGIVVIIRALRGPQGAAPFESRENVYDVLRVIVPTVVAAIALFWLGFYIVTAVYVAFFMWYVGKYKIWWDIPVGIALAVLFYVTFEQGFRVALPKSLLYTAGILPF